MVQLTHSSSSPPKLSRRFPPTRMPTRSHLAFALCASYHTLHTRSVYYLVPCSVAALTVHRRTMIVSMPIARSRHLASISPHFNSSICCTARPQHCSSLGAATRNQAFRHRSLHTSKALASSSSCELPASCLENFFQHHVVESNLGTSAKKLRRHQHWTPSPQSSGHQPTPPPSPR